MTNRIDVLEAKDLAPLFVCLEGELPHTGSRAFKNADYRTLWTEKDGKGKRFGNFIQVRSPKVAIELAKKYPDEISGVAASVIGAALEKNKGALHFGLGDIEKDAQFLFFTRKLKPEISAIVKWLRQNLSGDALVIRHTYCVRISFADENDFVLAKLKFT